MLQLKKQGIMAAKQPCHDPLCVPRDERYYLIPTPLLLPSASVAMPISPVAMMMTSPAPVSTYRSRHLPISSVPPFDSFDLLPTNLGRSMPWPVIIVVPIAIVVGKNYRWQRGKRKKYPVYPTRLHLILYCHSSNNQNCHYCQFHFVHYLHRMFLPVD
jgi:hypothetical protein